MAQCHANNQPIDVLLWVGCAGSYDDRYSAVMQSLTRLLALADIRFAILGEEESCTGDPARRSGNEFLFQSQALKNIETLNRYDVPTILTACPHCFNTLRNEYPALGGTYAVMHHSTFLLQLIKKGTLRVVASNEVVSYHDPCYLARANGVVEAPRELLRLLFKELREMATCKTKANCCGAGGAQVFKDAEPGTSEVHHQRSKEALDTQAKTLSVACPFCLLMLQDGLTHQAPKAMVVKDLAQLVEAHVVPLPKNSNLEDPST